MKLKNQDSLHESSNSSQGITKSNSDNKSVEKFIGMKRFLTVALNSNTNEVPIPSNLGINEIKLKPEDITDSCCSKLLGTDNYSKRLQRVVPPLRGCFSRFYNDPDMAIRWYDDIVKSLFEFIKREGGKNASSYHIWEKFQSDQKGPVAPVESTKVEEILEGLPNKPVRLNSQMKDMVADSRWNNLLSTIRSKINSTIIDDVDFSKEWEQLPSDTLRGFPYLQIGKEVDSEILSKAGSTISSALEYLLKVNSIPVYLAWRLQGTPNAEHAKTRPVMVPSVYYQYFNVGLYKNTMFNLKNMPVFAGWQEPAQRNATIMQMLRRAKAEGKRLIALDYSKFDQHIFTELRIKANYLSASLLDWKNQELKTTYLNIMSRLYNNQRLLLNRGKLVMLPLSNNLLSGVINTQQDGSLINIALQQYVLQRMQLDFDIDLSLALGDDTGLALPEKLVDSTNYKKTLERIDKILNELGMKSHTHKAYPTNQLVFLQKLWDLDLDILGQGSWTRSTQSFIWKEKYTKKPIGVKSVVAMEIIGQISIMNEAFTYQGDLTMNNFATIFVEKWLEIDDALMWVITTLDKKNSLSPSSLFNTLVKLAGTSFDQILSYLDKSSYDHSFLSKRFEAHDYGEVFYILPYLVNSKTRREIQDSKAREWFSLVDPQKEVEDLIIV